MKAINKTAQKVFDKLVALIPKGESSVKVDNSDGTFMAVHVERLTKTYLGTHYSVAHYHESYGDLVCDPDMTFVVGFDSRAYPMSFEMGGQIYERSVKVDGEEIHWNKRKQREHATFAGQWFRNIKSQQGL